MRTLAALAVLIVCGASSASASNLDVTAAYRMKAVSYKNLDLSSDPTGRNSHSFIVNDARLGMAVRKIPLHSRGGEDTTLDVGLLLHAIGVSGSTVAVASPFDRIAAYYPNADLTPFIENAYLRVNRLWSLPLEATFGRQNFKLGSGLLLDDGVHLVGGLRVSAGHAGDVLDGLDHLLGPLELLARQLVRQPPEARPLGGGPAGGSPRRDGISLRARRLRARLARARLFAVFRGVLEDRVHLAAHDQHHRANRTVDEAQRQPVEQERVGIRTIELDQEDGES